MKIFAEFPAVRKAYAENVPTKLTEQQFWTGYFQAQFFYRARNQQQSALKSDVSSRFLSLPAKRTSANADHQLCARVFSRCNEEEEKEPEIISKRLEPGTVDASEDIDADDRPLPSEGRGLVVPEAMDASSLAPSLDLVRRFNRHSAVVLGARPAATDDHKKATAAAGAEQKLPPLVPPLPAQYGVKSMSEIRDLEDPAPPHVSQLRIQDPRTYFKQNPPSSAPDGRLRPNSIGQMLEEMAARPKTKDELCSMLLAGSSKVLTEFQESVRLSSSMTSTGPPRKAADPPEPGARELYAKAAELSRHLWSCYPLTSESAKARAKQIAAMIEAEHSSIAQKLDSIEGDPHPLTKKRQHILRTISNVLASALAKFTGKTK